MGEHLARIEFDLEQLQSAVESLKQRLDLLEASTLAPPSADARAGLPAQPPTASNRRMIREIT